MDTGGLAREAVAPMQPRRYPVTPPEERFWVKVEKTETCWLWTASLRHGYGQFWHSYERGRLPAHRYAYELLMGLIPEGLQIDHLCRNPACVNPAHMEAVTLVENVMRGDGPGAANARAAACLRGHPFDAENTYIDRRGRRQCRACRRQRQAQFRERNPDYYGRDYWREYRRKRAEEAK